MATGREAAVEIDSSGRLITFRHFPKIAIMSHTQNVSTTWRDCRSEISRLRKIPDAQRERRPPADFHLPYVINVTRPKEDQKRSWSDTIRLKRSLVLITNHQERRRQSKPEGKAAPPQWTPVQSMDLAGSVSARGLTAEVDITCDRSFSTKDQKQDKPKR